MSWNRSWIRFGNLAMRVTMKNWNWACAALPPAFMMMADGWWRACPFQPRPINCTINGLTTCSKPAVRFHRRSATNRTPWAERGHTRLDGGLQPLPDPNRIGGAGQGAGGVQQHNGQLTPVNLRQHD